MVLCDVSLYIFILEKVQIVFLLLLLLRFLYPFARLQKRLVTRSEREGNLSELKMNTHLFLPGRYLNRIYREGKGTANERRREMTGYTVSHF